MADAHSQDIAADMVAAVLLHSVPDLADFTVLDALLEAIVVHQERVVVLAAWQRAKLRRELDARNIILPAYSL